MKQYGKTWLLIAAVTSLLLSYGSNLVNPYYYDVIIGIGINIILAVGLNLVNGYTGQFSLGHAGFMAVGAYVGASITVFLGGWYGGIFGEGMIAEAALFLFSLIAGGLAAALEAVKAPAGMDLGAITPEEIALSILAEITLHRRRDQRVAGMSQQQQNGAN